MLNFGQGCSNPLSQDLIVTSYINGWYLFWYQWKDVRTYTLVVNLGYMTFSIDNLEGGCNNPPSENMFGKTLRITLVKLSLHLPLFRVRGLQMTINLALVKKLFQNGANKNQHQESQQREPYLINFLFCFVCLFVFFKIGKAKSQ